MEEEGQKVGPLAGALMTMYYYVQGGLSGMWDEILTITYITS